MKFFDNPWAKITRRIYPTVGRDRVIKIFSHTKEAGAGANPSPPLSTPRAK